MEQEKQMYKNVETHLLVWKQSKNIWQITNMIFLLNKVLLYNQHDSDKFMIIQRFGNLFGRLVWAIF